MKKILAIASITFLTSCLGDGIEKEKTNNPEYDVTFLFEKDGIKVYRFFDGHFHYFTSTGETISTGQRNKTYQEENIKSNKSSYKDKF
jgi:hypothetical protein